MHKGTTKYRDSSKERVTQRCCTDRATFCSFFLLGLYMRASKPQRDDYLAKPPCSTSHENYPAVWVRSS